MGKTETKSNKANSNVNMIRLKVFFIAFLLCMDILIFMKKTKSIKSVIFQQFFTKNYKHHLNYNMIFIKCQEKTFDKI